MQAIMNSPKRKCRRATRTRLRRRQSAQCQRRPRTADEKVTLSATIQDRVTDECPSSTDSLTPKTTVKTTNQRLTKTNTGEKRVALAKRGSSDDSPKPILP